MGRSTLAALVVSLALLGSAAVVAAQTYRWTDERGQSYYGQGLDSVPERYRAGAQPLSFPAAPPEPRPAAPAAPAGTARIRFTPGQPIWVNARINDAGSVQLLLDTGASVTTISPRVLDQLGVSIRSALQGSIRGVTGTAPALFVTLERIEVAGATAGPLRVVAHDPELGQGDGLLGRDFLDRFAVNIDNAAGLVTLTPR
jgi:hypothetical protein